MDRVKDKPNAGAYEGEAMASTEQFQEKDITKLVEMAREKVKDDKVISWIIEHSPFWKSAGYSEIIKAIKGAGITLE